MSVLSVQAVAKRFGERLVFSDVSFRLAHGDRVGLVGPNGVGKTTLLRIGAGLESADAGNVALARGTRIGFMEQEVLTHATGTVEENARGAAAHLRELEAEMHELEPRLGSGDQELLERYSEAQHQFEHAGGYDFEATVGRVLGGLGLDALRDRQVATLSGGERTRLGLARLLLDDPDLLLLDEPTNHLDIAALEWLEEHLRRRHGAVLVASHDRAFLDAAATRIWELRDRKLTAFRGDYSAYHRQRVERDARSAKEADSQADSIERERELVQRYRSHRKFSKMHEHEARLERLQAERVDAPRSGRRMRLPAGALVGGGAARSGEIVVRAENLVVGYLPGRGALDAEGRPATEARRVATAPFLATQRGDRIGIVGPNGAGKTTLLRTIAGDLPPIDGTLALGSALQIGYLAQIRESAIPGATVLHALLHSMPVTAGEARGFLARFLFRGDDVFKEVRLLSGGE